MARKIGPLRLCSRARPARSSQRVRWRFPVSARPRPLWPLSRHALGRAVRKPPPVPRTPPGRGRVPTSRGPMRCSRDGDSRIVPGVRSPPPSPIFGRRHRSGSPPEDGTDAGTTSPAASSPSRPASPEGHQPLFTGPGLPLSQTTWPSSSAPDSAPPPPSVPEPSQPTAETSTSRAPVQGAATAAGPPPPPGDDPSDDDGGDDDPAPSPDPPTRICRHCGASIGMLITWE